MILIMPHCNLQDLTQFQKELHSQEKFPPDHIVKYLAYQSFQAIDYFQQRKMEHHDVKNDNFFLHDFCRDSFPKEKQKIKDYEELTMRHVRCFLGDMGQARIKLNDNKHKEGTPVYNPPEFFSSKNPGTQDLSDIWSLGLTWLRFKTGKGLFLN